MAERSPGYEYDDAADYVCTGPSAADLTAYLAADPDRGFAYDETGSESPLVVAAVLGRLDLARVLVALGADVDAAPDGYDDPPEPEAPFWYDPYLKGGPQWSPAALVNAATFGHDALYAYLLPLTADADTRHWSAKIRAARAKFTAKEPARWAAWEEAVWDQLLPPPGGGRETSRRQ